MRLVEKLQSIGVDPEFQSTHPVRGATSWAYNCGYRLLDFNPRTPCGVRPSKSGTVRCSTIFQSTHPVRGATEAGDSRLFEWLISIHAPRAGCDLNLRDLVGLTCISIHAPRAGCDLESSSLLPLYLLFQSTHPVRGATALKGVVSSGKTLFQSTHPVRGATLELLRKAGIIVISIHAPRAGCDLVPLPHVGFNQGFQSTHPVRGATGYLPAGWNCSQISIHAPRAGCDTSPEDTKNKLKEISIHAPRAGCDYCWICWRNSCGRFQSTHPVRGATRLSKEVVESGKFQSTHPVRGATSVTSWMRFVY